MRRLLSIIFCFQLGLALVKLYHFRYVRNPRGRLEEQDGRQQCLRVHNWPRHQQQLPSHVPSGRWPKHLLPQLTFPGRFASRGRRRHSSGAAIPSWLVAVCCLLVFHETLNTMSKRGVEGDLCSISVIIAKRLRIISDHKTTG